MIRHFKKNWFGRIKEYTLGGSTAVTVRFDQRLLELGHAAVKAYNRRTAHLEAGERPYVNTGPR